MRVFPSTIALAIAAASCGDSSPTMMTTAATQLVWSAPASLPIADLSTVPWPNDLLRDASGHIQVTSFAPRLSVTPLGPRIAADLATRDGFGVTSGAFFPATASLDGTTLDGHVHLLDLGGKDPETPLTIFYRDDEQVLHARPANGHVLRQKNLYAYVITSGVLDAKGKPVSAPAELATLLAATARPGDAPHGAAWDQLQKLAPALAAINVKQADIIGFTVFTTQSVTADLEAIRAALQTGAPPSATVGFVFAATPTKSDDGSLDDLFGKPVAQRPGADNAGGLAHDAIAFVVQGSIVAPDWLFASTPSTDPTKATPSKIGVIGFADGKPKQLGSATVPFTLVLPKIADGASYANVPTVIFQHGLGGDRATVCVLANTLAHAGFATIGIDIPFHGMRRGHAVDAIHNFNPTLAGPDGWADDGDESLLAFFDSAGDKTRGILALQPDVFRGSFQQSVSDIMLEVRMIAESKLDALGQRDTRLTGLSLRGDRILYSGESFGSILGGQVLAIEPRLQGAVLSVGGGGFITPLLTWSVEYGILAPLLEGAVGVYASANPPESDFGYNLFEQLIEPSDPLAMARQVISEPLAGATPRHILLFEALHDESVPNIAAESLAVALGLDGASVTAGGTPTWSWETPALTTHAAPLSGNRMVAGSPVTAAILQMTPASHGMFTEQHGQSTSNTTTRPFKKLAAPVKFDNPIDALHAIYAAFATDFFAGKTPTLIDPPAM